MGKTKPGKPYAVGQASSEKVELVWEPPEEVWEDCSYVVRSKEDKPKSKWQNHSKCWRQCTAILKNLNPSSKYEFQVRMINDDGEESPFSEKSNPVEIIPPATQYVLQMTRDVIGPDGRMPLKKLILKENRDARDEKGRTRKLVLGTETEAQTKQKTIMIVGATGAGKSTLVDGMINYILGVNWSDPYRLTLVDMEADEQKTSNNQYFRKWIRWQTTNVSYGTTVAQNGSLSLTMCLRRCEDSADCVSAHVNKANFSCELSNYCPPYNTLTATPRNGWTVYYRELRQVQGIRAWIASVYGDCYAENGIDGQVIEYFDIRYCRCTHSWGPNSFWIMEFQFPGNMVMVTPYFRTGMAVQRNTYFRLWVYKSYDDARNDVADILCTEYTGPGIQSLTNFICKQQPYGGALKIQHFLKDEPLQFCEMKVFVV